MSQNTSKIRALKISVRTVGPSTWSVSVDKMNDARQARADLVNDGLRCSDIERSKHRFVFTADAQHVTGAPMTDRNR